MDTRIAHGYLANHRQHVARFYELLRQLRAGLGGSRMLCDCGGAMSWPTRGVYFFFEPGEFRRDEPDELRVVRIGTHAVSAGSRTTLWHRLRGHRGNKDGRGNHRGSIFRQHVGNALLARAGGALSSPSWGIRRSAPREVRQQEVALERQVSEYIGKMPFLWLEVDDEAGTQSRRAYLERNCLGMLTTQIPRDPPSAGWLGNHSPEPLIRRSGLWNLNHVGAAYDPDVLDVLADHVASTVAKHASTPSRTVTPHPDCLRAFIGGFMETSYGLRWENDALFYDRFEQGYTLAETEQLQPCDGDWAEFWSRLENIGVWSWRGEYLNPDVCDGTNWSLQVMAGGAALSAAGQNAYPDHFELFCDAVSKLAGGRTFA